MYWRDRRIPRQLGHMPRRDSNPLPGWQQGTAPDRDPAPAPAPAPAAPTDDTYLQGDFSVYNAEYMLMLRATNWVRATYGISPWEWRRQHDKLALQALEKLKRGEPLPESRRFTPSPWAPDLILTRHIGRGYW